ESAAQGPASAANDAVFDIYIPAKAKPLEGLLMDAIELERRYCAHNYEPLPVVLARGLGAHLWDTSGRRYVDMMSAYSAASLGHAHPRILAALDAQARRLAVPSRAYYSERLGPFLAELCRLTGLDAALPMNTGA